MNDSQMQTEEWRISWRQNVAPQLPTKGLKGLLKGLLDDDKNIVQCIVAGDFRGWGNTGNKPEMGCAIGYSFIKSGHKTCGSVHDRYSNMTGGISKFTRWFDHTQRDEMRTKLIPEVQAELARRGVA